MSGLICTSNENATWSQLSTIGEVMSGLACIRKEIRGLEGTGETL